jgi:hypothetical protein
MDFMSHHQALTFWMAVVVMTMPSIAGLVYATSQLTLYTREKR